MKKTTKQPKRKVLLTLEEDVIELLEKGTKEFGCNKSQFITKLLKDNVENRLSKYIARDIENLLLFSILQNNEIKEINKDETIKKLKELKKQTNIIKSSKFVILKEERLKKEKKEREMKSFWNRILKMLEPKTFVNSIAINGKYDEKKTKIFLNDLQTLIKENRILWEK